MNSSKYLVIGVFSLLAFSGEGAMAQAPEPSGKAVYMKYGCYQCHGTIGQGALTGPRLAPDTIPYAAFRLLVRYPSQRMPPYPEANLQEKDLRVIHEYLTTILPPPSAEDIPLLLERRSNVQH